MADKKLKKSKEQFEQEQTTPSVMTHEAKSWKALWQGVVGEFVATYLFLFFTIGTVVFTDPNWSSMGGAADANARHMRISFSFGLMIAVLVVIFGPISGANINPAVTVALAITTRITVLRAVMYIIAQILGAFLGSYTIYGMIGRFFVEAGCGCNVIAEIPNYNWTESMKHNNIQPLNAAVGFEFIGTGLLIITVFTVITSNDHANKLTLSAFGPLAIGLAVFLAHIMGIPIDGTSINPARTLGAALTCQIAIDNEMPLAKKWDAYNGLSSSSTFSELSLTTLKNNIWRHFWVYMIIPLLAGAVFALFYDFALDDDYTAAIHRFKAGVKPTVTKKKAPEKIAPENKKTLPPLESPSLNKVVNNHSL